MLAWFFCKLLLFGYVEDLDTGMAFRLPGGLQWKIFVEVRYCTYTYVPMYLHKTYHILLWCNNLVKIYLACQ